MRKTSLTVHALAGALILLTAACGSDSTGPKGPTASAAALHFDTLEVQAAAHNWGGRSEFLTLLELAAASGQTPSPISVTVGGSAQTWYALTISAVDTDAGGQVSDSGMFTVAYSDYANVTNGVISEVDINGGTTFYTIIVLSDSIFANASTATYSGSITSTGGACGLVTGLQNAAVAATQARYTCTKIKAQSSLTATFPATPGLDASLQSVSFSNVSANGVRLFQ
jgi:hypothetical protein